MGVAGYRSRLIIEMYRHDGGGVSGSRATVAQPWSSTEQFNVKKFDNLLYPMCSDAVERKSDTPYK